MNIKRDGSSLEAGALQIGRVRIGRLRIGPLRIGPLQIGRLRIGSLRIGPLPIGQLGRLLIGCLVIGAACPGSARAFTSPWHTEMTSEALSDNGFSSQALSEVVSANLATDVLYLDDSDFHYDNCNWTGTLQQRQLLEAQIVSVLKHKDYAAARTYLGEILHQTQDFYSHSNWEEYYNGSAPELVPLADVYGSRPSWWFSGLYNDHSYLDPTADSCPAGTPAHADFNKDTPLSTEGSSSCGYLDPATGLYVTCFEAAYTSAVRATEQQWASLVSLIEGSFCNKKSSCAAGDKAVRGLQTAG